MGNLFSQENRYEAKTVDEIRYKLREYGFCYVPNMLTEEERVAMISGTWDFFEHLTQKDEEEKIKRHDTKSWKHLASLCPNNDMIYHAWNAGHSQHLWDIRQNPKIVALYAQLWSCNPEDLLVSFDGFAFLPPPEVTNEGWYTPDSKQYHIDQSLERPYFDGYQGFITAYDINDGDATISLYEKSHLLIPEFIETFGIINKSDWVRFSTLQQIKFFHSRCKEVQIKCPANSLVIWDSRTVHTPVKPLKNREQQNTRCIAYLSYSRKTKATVDAIAEKKMAFEHMITTNHYAHKPGFFNTLPRGHQNIQDYVVPINRPVLTKIGLSLVGYDQYEIHDLFTEINLESECLEED